MYIEFKYELSNRYTSSTVVDVSANEAPIGTLDSVVSEQLNWSPDDRIYNIKFQFRNEDTFLSVVSELKRYKTEHGYKYLTIQSYNNGYAAQIDKALLEKAGFKHLPDQLSGYMFLE